MIITVTDGYSGGDPKFEADIAKANGIGMVGFAVGNWPFEKVLDDISSNRYVSRHVDYINELADEAETVACAANCLV